MGDDDAFTIDDLEALTDVVSGAWLCGAERDWSAQAGTVEWSCWHTADHAVDCVMAPALFLASRQTGGYAELWRGEFTLGDKPDVARLVHALQTASRLLAGAVLQAPPDARAVIFRHPVIEAPPADFIPRGALELILHAHDVCQGLGVAFEPPAEVCFHLREHTRDWPPWTYWQPLGTTDDPWHDLLVASARA